MNINFGGQTHKQIYEIYSPSHRSRDAVRGVAVEQGDCDIAVSGN